MRNLLPVVFLSSAAAVASVAPALADRDPTSEERTRIEAVLRDEGFTAWEDIELEDEGHWEIDDAVGADGREYDLHLDTNLNIIRRDPD
jgi:membrane protein implicated in regulation of membrane protease activity